jgi:hypothetical protein
MKVLLWLILLGGALFALHHFALWAERRGWIYYKNRKASPASVGSAFLLVQSLLEPGKRHIVESRLEDVAEADESGDPPDPPENDKVA